MMKIKSGLHPTGGYFFTEPDGTRHIANGPINCIKKITDYRRRNGLALGDPKAEFYRQHCERNPTHCFSKEPVPAGGVAEALPVKPRSLKGGVLAWLMSMRRRKSDLRWVGADETRRRVDICLRCPKNQNISGTCSSCKAALSGLRTEILGDKPLVDARAAGCAALNEDIPISSMLDDPAVEPEGLPGHCWRRRQ